jgi:transcriptional regulator GlxA family with amidase domain
LVKLYAHDKSPQLEEALVNDLRKLFVLVRYLLEHADRREGRIESVHQSQSRTIESIMRYMETNYREDLSLDRLSGLVHLNGSYLIRLFKKHQGQTPFQYLSELRMNAATSYLENSSLSIQDIALASGYSSLHYFSHAFKLKFGISPGESRSRTRRQPD